MPQNRLEERNVLSWKSWRGGPRKKRVRAQPGRAKPHGVRGLQGPTEVLGKQTTEGEKVARCTP